MCALFVALKNQSPWWRKELVRLNPLTCGSGFLSDWQYISTIIACGGWAANHFASQRFVNRNDISSAIGYVHHSFILSLAYDYLS